MYRLGLFSFICMLAGCKYDNVRVHSYWGTTVERPAAGSVYDWAAESGHLDPGMDVHISRAIESDVERELGAMGFIKRNGNGAPDILISTHMGRGLQPSPSGPEQRATLVVQVHDAADGRLIYSACADALIEPSLCPEERRARIDRAIHQAMLPLTPCVQR